MSLNWKEINLVLEELDLAGAQIQSAVQSAFDVLCLRLHKKGETKQVLVALSPGACRICQTFKAVPKSDKPLRFAQFLNSRVVNGWVEEAAQLGDNRIVRLLVRRGESRLKLYIRLWSNAANVIVTDSGGTVLDAMRRLPKKGETGGGRYAPEEAPQPPATAAPRRQYEIRALPPAPSAGGSGGSFNEKVDAYYAEQGGALSLDALREQARRNCEGSMGRISAALERLRAKEADFASAEKLREHGSAILANAASIPPGSEWLETEGSGGGGQLRIKLSPRKTPAQTAEQYFAMYRKAKTGLASVRAEIQAGEAELRQVGERLTRLLAEGNPLVLAKLLKGGANGGARTGPAAEADRKRPGLTFRRGDWLIIVGRDAAENDELLRRHVKGGDLWLHARDFPGSYVFVKQRPGKTVPLEILLDAGNLALFYSKGRNSGGGDLFYTPVKHLRRAKGAPKGLVIPTHEKNLRVKTDPSRLRELETCRVEK